MVTIGYRNSFIFKPRVCYCKKCHIPISLSTPHNHTSTNTHIHNMRASQTLYYPSSTRIRHTVITSLSLTRPMNPKENKKNLYYNLHHSFPFTHSPPIHPAIPAPYNLQSTPYTDRQTKRWNRHRSHPVPVRVILPCLSQCLEIGNP